MKHAMFAAILLFLSVLGTGSAYSRDLRDELLQAKEYDKAIAECTRLIASREGDRKDKAYSYWVRGYAYLMKGERDRAVEDYGRAIDLEPTPDRYYERGELHQSMTRYREAREDFQKAAQLYEAPHDARKDRYNAQQARARAESAAQRGQWDLWFSVLLLCAIAGYVLFKSLRSPGKKPTAWVAVFLAAALVAFVVIERSNPFGWSLRFISLVQIAWTIAVCGFAISIALLLFSYIWERMKVRRKTAVAPKPAAVQGCGDPCEKERGESRDEDRRFCPRCGAATFQMEDVRFCHNCGAPLAGARLQADSAGRGGAS
jgi:tetratricopeptide (TPR) repeat protein